MSGCHLPSRPHYSCGTHWLSPLATVAGGALSTVLLCSLTPHFAAAHRSSPSLPLYSLSPCCQKNHVEEACLQGFHSTCSTLMLHYGDPRLSLSLVM